MCYEHAVQNPKAIAVLCQYISLLKEKQCCKDFALQDAIGKRLICPRDIKRDPAIRENSRAMSLGLFINLQKQSRHCRRLLIRNFRFRAIRTAISF